MSFSINSEKGKSDRKIKITKFVSNNGNGKQGLSEEQRKKRIEKILGSEKEKIKGFGKKKTEGVDLLIRSKQIPSFMNNSLSAKHEFIPEETKKVFNDLPDDIRADQTKVKNKILSVEVDAKGRMFLTGIVLDGFENDVNLRSSYSVMSQSDEDSARLEANQYKKGKLKEVSDRTMKIHDENGLLDELLENPDIDTDEDKELQY